LLVTGHARQSLDWIAEHGDGWLYYQLPLGTLAGVLEDWRGATDGSKPFAQALHVQLDSDPTAGMSHVHQGYAAGSEWFVSHVRELADLGVDHLAISIRGGDRDERAVLDQFADEVMAEL